VDKLWKQAVFAGESKTQDIVFVQRETRCWPSIICLLYWFDKYFV